MPSLGITLGGPLVTALGARQTILLSGLATIGLAVIAGVVIVLARTVWLREEFAALHGSSELSVTKSRPPSS